jgi:hypothetical protein
MHVEVLVEELSAKKALDLLLPKILGEPHTFVVHDFQGKADLLGSLPVRLRGYAARFKKDDSTADWRIVVLIDEDRADCHELKEQVLADARRAGLAERVLARIAVEELEAWFFGDIEALCAVYPKLPATLPKQAKYRNPDAIAGGTWEALDRILKKASYSAGLQKIAAAEAIASQMVPERNRSRSFRTFRQGLLRIVQE